MRKYIIVSGPNHTDFSDQVTKKLNAGFELYGELIVSDDSRDFKYRQAMIQKPTSSGDS